MLTIVRVHLSASLLLVFLKKRDLRRRVRLLSTSVLLGRLHEIQSALDHIKETQAYLEKIGRILPIEAMRMLCCPRRRWVESL